MPCWSLPPRPDRPLRASADEQELLALVHRCRELSLKVSVLPQLFSALGPSVEVDDVEGVTVLGINPPVLLALVPLPEAVVSTCASPRGVLLVARR